jgi:rhamnosyltransferase
VTPDVAIVVASYLPPPEVVDRITRLVATGYPVVVSDDGSPAASAPVLARIEEAGATVLRSPCNRGIAASLNSGLAKTAELGEFRFVLTLDQDSMPQDGYIDNAVATFERARAAGLRPGIVSAESYSDAIGPRERRHGRPREFSYAFDPMQSGLLIPRTTFDAVGTFDEGFVIDAVDSEFTVRARAAGLDIVVGQGCRLDHSLGQLTIGHIFGISRAFNYHSPMRAYYITRNGTAVTLRYLFRRPGWVARRLWYEAQAHLVRTVLSADRGKQVFASFSGMRDAFLRRSGHLPAALGERLASAPHD